MSSIITDATLRRMEKIAQAAAAKSYSPYSKFPVGAAVLAANGKIYGGCNVENASYPTGTCAETAAISAMILAGEPDLKNGYEVAQYIRQSPRLAHIPVVLLTGAFEPVDEARAAAAGCDGVLAKPFEPQLVIVDSVQTVSTADATGIAGGPGQVREVAAAITRGHVRVRHTDPTLLDAVTRKLEEADEAGKIAKVDKSLSKAIMQARTAKKMTQKDLATAIWSEGAALNPQNETLRETIRRLRGTP